MFLFCHYFFQAGFRVTPIMPSKQADPWLNCALRAAVKTATPAACPAAQTPLYVRANDTGSWTSRSGVGTTVSRLPGVDTPA
jgi:hypothetical protein